MRIAIISGKIPAPTFVERLISGLAAFNLPVLVVGKRLGVVAKRKHVTLVALSKKYERIHRIFLTCKYAVLLFVRHPASFLKLFSLSKTITYEQCAILWFQPQVVHIQWPKTIKEYLWVQKFGIKLLVSLRGAQINYSPIANLDLAEVYRQVFPICDGFHAVSHAMCKEASQYGMALDKCKVVYSGFNLSHFPIPSDITHKPGSVLHIVSVGRGHWKKGFHYALDAIHRLKSRGVNLSYQIVGVGANEELTFQLNELDLSDCVVLRETASFSEVLEVIRHADLFLLPSVEEGIANVVIEAMLLGTPVITTNCGGMEELVSDGETGIVVPLRDPEAIANAVLRFQTLSPEEINRMRMAAYEKACTQHNREQMVEGMLELYQNAVITES